jgi:hypothetical protein
MVCVNLNIIDKSTDDTTQTNMPYDKKETTTV